MCVCVCVLGGGGGRPSKKAEFQITCCGVVCIGGIQCSFESVGGLNVTDIRRERMNIISSQALRPAKT